MLYSILNQLLIRNRTPLENNGLFDNIDIHMASDDPNYQLVIDLNACNANLFEVKMDRPDSLYYYEAFN